jgi:hypothetical protein
MENKEVKKYVKYLILIIILTIGIFIFKFSNLSFKNSNPENWVEFVNYFGGILNPILTIINIGFFIKLTLAIKKANENNSWVEKTEKLTFVFIESFIELVSEILYVSDNKNFTKINSERFSNLNNTVREKNELIFKNQFALRVFAESKLFDNCNTRNEFISQSFEIIKSMNGFLNSVDGKTDINKISEKYRNFENELKNFIQIGKKFSDEIYNL